MPVYQKKIMDNFCSLVQTDFKAYCARHQLSPNTESFLTFLYDLKLLNENKIRKYTIIEEYEKMHNLPGFRKTKSIRLLADKFQVTDRAIWNMLSQKTKK